MSVRSDLRCKLCFYTANAPSVLENHVRGHIGEKPYQCSHCSYSCASKGALNQHIRGKHHEAKPFPCSYSGCQKRFKTKARLNVHTKSVHERLRPFKCSECAMRFFVRSGLKDHIVRRHTEDNQLFKCDMCDHKASTTSDLKSHIRNRHTPYLNLECNTCGSRQKNYQCLERHVRLYHRNPSKPKTLFKCKEPNCLKEFISSGTLHYHKVKEHRGGIRAFPCSICPYSAIDPYSLTVHMRTHTGERPYKCDECKRCFTTTGHLRSHKISVHSDLRPFKCNSCTYRGKSQVMLRLHERTHYPDAFKRLECKICHYKCTTRQLLQNHQMTHQDEKPFKCEQCSYKTKTRNNLREHTLTHSSDKPFKCLQCSYSCRHRYILSKHVLKHKDATPFVCLAVNCQAKYKFKSSLRYHLLRVHKTQVRLTCTFCPEVFYQEKDFQDHTQDHIRGRKHTRDAVESEGAASAQAVNLSTEQAFPPCFVLVKRLKIILQ